MNNQKTLCGLQNASPILSSLFFLENEKNHSQFCITDSTFQQAVLSSKKMFHQKKKKKLLLKTFSSPLITYMRDYSHFCFVFSHCSNNHHMLCIFHILIYLHYLTTPLVYILVAGFSWTSPWPSHSYSLASTALAEATADASSGAQTTPQSAGVI